MVAMSRILSSFGNEGCQCVNNTDVAASFTDRYCRLPNGDNGIRANVNGLCFPFAYGSSQCLQHDLLHTPECNISDDEYGITEMPLYCLRRWCYVDASCSRDSEERLYRSTYFPRESEIFYSYSTCNSTAKEWMEHKFGKVLVGGIKIHAAIPTYYGKFMYKRNAQNGDILTSTGREYYHDAVPFEGVCLNYAQSLQKISNGDISDISYTHRSKGSSVIHSESTFTASVQDVADGLVDMAVGPFWITGGRLRLAPFTVPMIIDKIYLVVPKQGVEEPFNYQFLKVLMPFTYGLWGVIVATIFLAALLHVWLVDPFVEGFSRAERQQTQQLESNSVQRIKSAYARMLIDDFLHKLQEFTGAAVAYEDGASLSVKILDFGFSFFVLVAVATYVANLAAFLTRSMISESMSTMEGVVFADYKICAHPVIEEELRVAWPKADFYFHKEGKEYMGMLGDYSATKCDVLLFGWEDASMDEDLLKKVCKLDLVFTNSIVLEIPMGFPIRPELAKGFSYWMYQGSEKHDISFQAAKDNYVAEAPMDVCNVQLASVDSEESDYIQIEIKNLALPIAFFLCCAFLAGVIRLVEIYWTKKYGRGRAAVLGRNSFLSFTKRSAMSNSIMRAAVNEMDEMPVDDKEADDVMVDSASI